MPILEPDTSQAVELGAIAPGTYAAKITKCEAKTSKEKGTPMCVPTFAVLVDGKERPRTSYLVVTGQRAWQFDQLLRSVRMAELADRYKAGEKVPFDTDVLVGQELQVVISEDTYQGNKTDKITGFLPA